MADSAEWNPEKYIVERLDVEIQWYDNKSGWNKRWFQVLRVVETVFAAAIPVLASLCKVEWNTVVMGIFGGIIVVVSGTLGLYKFHEHWIEYRTTAESLKKEKYLFLTGTEPYGQENSFPTLVQRVETLVSKENTNWAQYMMRPGKEDKRG